MNGGGLINDVNRLLTILSNEPRGKIIICNIFATLEEKLLNEDIIRDFLEYLLKYVLQKYVKFSNLNIQKIIRAFEEVVETDASTRQFLLKCQKEPYDGEVVNVMSWFTFTKHYLVEEKITSGHSYINIIDNPVDPVSVEEHLKLIHKDPGYLKDEAFLRTRAPFFWIAPAEDLAGISSADEIRDVLGLIHFGSGIHLIKIIITCKDIQNRQQARPTFIEGGGHRRFKVKHSNTHYKDWGYTVHLERFAHGAPNIDGVRERVVEPLPFKDLKNFRIEYIGKTTNSRATTPLDNAFVDRICPRNIQQIINTLISLLY